MNQMNWSTLRRMNAAEIKQNIPAEILFEGEVLCVLASIEDMIVVSDLHPRVRNSLKALERKARGGMAKPVRVEETGA